MHMTIVWEHFLQGDEAAELDSFITDLFIDRPHAKALSKAYIINVDDADGAKALQKKILEKVRSLKYKVDVLFTPATTGGRYNGFIPGSRWKAINERSAS